ncbi:MAG: threonyl-tRNA synthetase editing domain-containing protein [Nitrospiraceae bacterium]|nr:MAG: threonyl-tRNA synthetase editing domain-containing protein [Nitrospiraceae bacterium]
MKILMFYSPSFWFRTFEKVLDNVADQEADKTEVNAIVIFYHIEAEDVERKSKILTKFIKNIKWIAGKFKTSRLVLHSFNHLSTSKAPPDFSAALMSEARERLVRSGFEITETPFGYLNEWKMHVAGDSLAKVFKDL